MSMIGYQNFLAQRSILFWEKSVKSINEQALRQTLYHNDHPFAFQITETN